MLVQPDRSVAGIQGARTGRHRDAHDAAATAAGHRGDRIAVSLARRQLSRAALSRAARDSPADLPAPALGGDLPLADVAAFSIDDSATTEIDDAFSVTPVGGRSGARRYPHRGAGGRPRTRRMRSMPSRGRACRPSTRLGFKITMLPPGWVDAYSLVEGREVPVLSLYADVDRASFGVLGTEIAGRTRTDCRQSAPRPARRRSSPTSRSPMRASRAPFAQ